MTLEHIHLYHEGAIYITNVIQFPETSTKTIPSLKVIYVPHVLAKFMEQFHHCIPCSEFVMISSHFNTYLEDISKAIFLVTMPFAFYTGCYSFFLPFSLPSTFILE